MHSILCIVLPLCFRICTYVAWVLCLHYRYTKYWHTYMYTHAHTHAHAHTGTLTHARTLQCTISQWNRQFADRSGNKQVSTKHTWNRFQPLPFSSDTV